jgi:hypothetical protein
VTEIIDPYTSRINAAVKSAKEGLNTTETTLTQWKSNINTLFPVDSADDLTNAINEGKRQTAECKVTEEIEKVGCKRDLIPGEFQKLVEPFESYSKQSIGPPMRQEAKRSEACGFSALAAAVDRGIAQLESAAEDGSKAVKRSIKATRQQLTTHLNASRSGLREQADAQLEKLKQEAQTANNRIIEAHESQKQGLTESQRSYREAIVNAAIDGVSNARTAALNGAGETRATFKTLRKSHLKQCEQIVSGSREGLDKTHTQFWESSNASVVMQNEASRVQVEQTSEQLRESTAQRRTSMNMIQNGVKQTVDIWSMDLSTKYAAQIQTTKDNLKQCEKGFGSKLDNKVGEVKQWLDSRKNPTTFFATDLTEIATRVRDDVNSRVKKLIAEFDDIVVHDDVITDAVRGVTELQGWAVTDVFRTKTHKSLYSMINEYTSGDDKTAIKAYLLGDEAKGAEYELKASVGFFNDDEARIRKTLRSLDDENLTKLLERDKVSGVLDDVRDNLGGVDLKVFNTLVDKELPHIQRLARADAYDLEHKLSRARTREEINDELARFYANRPDSGYGDISNEQLRQELNNQMAVVLKEKESGKDLNKQQEQALRGDVANEAMLSFVSQRHQSIRQYEQMRCGHHGCHQSAYTEKRERFNSAQEDRSRAIIEHGVNSKEDRIALLGIEANRAGGGKMEKIDSALVDPRLNPNVLDPNHYQDGIVPPSAVAAYNQALRERQEVLQGVAQNYGNQDASSQQSVNNQVINLLNQGQSKLGRQVINGLVSETFPSAQTSSMLIEYAAGGYFDGTNETLMKQATTRLDREQIAAAEDSYAGRTGKSLWRLVASETSGQDFLDMELAWMGKPRNDREKAEVALFAIHQQKREAGVIGKALMSGSMAESAMNYDEQNLNRLAGGSISFSDRGEPPKVTIRNANFDKRGRFTGQDRSELLSAATSARESAALYAEGIDEWANAVTTTISIIGAVVATVVTGGGASPLLAAAIAGGFGLAGMAAKQTIKGGRYGWEEALTDLGMTGVQMVTAGLGQKLQKIAELSKAMGPLQKALLPTVVTGGLDSMGQAVLNEGTWKDGFGKGMEEVLAGTFKGVLTATVATLGAQALQKIPIGKALNSADDLADDAAGISKKFTTIGDLADSTNYFSRTAAQSFQSAGSSFMSTGAGIGFDALRGKYKGTWEDAFKEMGKSAGQAAFQGIFEGTGEAWRDKNKVKFGTYTRPGWMDPGEYAAMNAPPSRNQQGQSGTAAAVEGSRFRGDVNTKPVVDKTHVSKGLKDLTADGGFLQGKARLDPEGDGMRVMLTLDDGSEIPIHFKTVDEMTLTEKGIPVAEFHGDGKGYAVHVSSKADPEMIQRAMVHELTEIRHLKRPNANTDDVLRPGGPTTKRPEGEPQLSPHDRARIAELEFMQRQIDIARAKKPVDAARIRQLNDETMTLLTHLGVVNDTPGAKHRRSMLDEHLPGTRMRDAIDASIKAAREDVRFHYRGADHDAALDMLVRQWEHHKSVGDTETAGRILDQIRRRLMRMEHISTDRRFKDEQQKLGETIDQHVKSPELIDAMKRLLKEEGIVSESKLRNDPASEDPHGAQAVRREFGDNPNFQDWAVFKQKFFDTFKTADSNDPIHLDRAYFEWSTGAYVSETTGRMRSVLSDISRPHPDFQHQWKEGKHLQAEERAKLKARQELDHSLEGLFKATDTELVRDGDLSDSVQKKIESLAEAHPQTPLTVNDAATLRHELLGEARRIEAILKKPGNRDDATLARLRKLHHDLEHQAIKLSETLGEAAARKVAELEKGNWEPVELDGQGAGLPDVVYRDKETGRLLVIEAKGGGSQLGTRLSSDQRIRVEQGTRAYLESLARTMMKSTSQKTRDLGAELMGQLARPDGVDYRLVKQRFDADGKPQAPEVGHFDIGDPPNAAETHRNAAAIADSRFHGERRKVLRNKEKHLVKAADELVLSNEGIGGLLTRVRGEENGYMIESPTGEKIKVVVEPIAANKLPLHESGRANAQWEPVRTPGDQAGFAASYRIQVSDRMDPAMIGRALAHDFREVYQDFKAGGNSKEKVAANEHQLDFSTPHGKARIEEITWLNRQIQAGDPKGIYKNEMSLLLKHVGADPAQGNPGRQAEVADILISKGLMTRDIWRAIDGPALMQRMAPFDAQAHREVTDAMADLRTDSEVNFLLVSMEVMRRNIERTNGAPENPDNPPVALMSHRHQELVRQLDRIFMQVPGEGQHRLFTQLLPHRDALYRALGITELQSLSRMDTENFIREIYEAHRNGTLIDHEALRNESQQQKDAAQSNMIYQRYSDSTAQKQFDREGGGQEHREGVIDALRQKHAQLVEGAEQSQKGPGETQEIPWIPENIDVSPQTMLNIYQMLNGGDVDDFVHFTMKKESSEQKRQAKYRIYINPAPDETLPMLRELLLSVISNPHNDAYKIKTHSDPDEIMRRAEGLVVYSESLEGHNAALAQLFELYRQHPERFIPAVPRMTEPLARGISVAEQPEGTGGGSFGGHRRNRINSALKDLPDNATFEEFRRRVLEQFKKNNIDLDYPHMNPKKP